MLLDLDTTGTVVDIESLDADDVLEYAADTARSVRAAERRTLRVMARWGALNPDRAYAWSVPGMIRHGLDEFAAEPLALALDISPVNAGCNLAEVMELVHRLPRVWAMVEDLTLPGWRARRIASQTQVLNDTGAAYVDRKVAASAPAHRAWARDASSCSSPKPPPGTTPTPRPRSRRRPAAGGTCASPTTSTAAPRPAPRGWRCSVTPRTSPGSTT